MDLNRSSEWIQKIFENIGAIVESLEISAVFWNFPDESWNFVIYKNILELSCEISKFSAKGGKKWH